jgi:tRNA(fMet)-specific endonuclease VapC
MLVLDTDLLTLVQLESGDAYRRLHQRLQVASRTDFIAVTIVTVEEQMRGWLAQVARAKTVQREVVAYHRLRNLVMDYRDRRILEYDAAAAQLFQQSRSAKIRIGTMDLKIAAITLTHGAKLLSRNLKDFRKVPGLDVEDWTSE